MSRRRSEATISPLEKRLEALKEATELGDGRLSSQASEEAWALLERASTRRTLSSEHTVVGFFGATGSGKSSLFNAVVGENLARTAATRPTTSKPLAAIWNTQGATSLLDWLEVHDRHVLTTPLRLAKKGIFGSEKEANGLILLDLPDFDSTTLENREVAVRLSGQVDVLIWVMDPQKYADAAVHHDFITPLSAHGAVTLVVLNQIDTLREAQREPVLTSLRSILERDGLTDPQLVGVSATTGEGIDDLRGRIAKIVTERGATTRRLAADVVTVAENLGQGQTNTALNMPTQGATNQVTRKLAQAAGIETVVDAVRKTYMLDATKKAGWPLTRWLSKIRPDPLRRLNLKSTDINPQMNRTSLPVAGAAEKAQADSAVREFADQSSTGATDAWKAAIRRSARQDAAALPDKLDQAIANADVGATKGSWWWPIISVIQWVSLVTALTGALWLGALAVVQYLQFSLPPAPQVEGIPVPTLMLVIGILLGIILGILTSFAARAGGAGRARKARKVLLGAVHDVVDASVIQPVSEEVNRHNQFIGALARARN
ncbi:ABC transporter [Arthrobacter sp. MYb227]|uniref:GTPase n=1 Tax=Arthrobacter sp. MYb227 TaxID=1848601 RepID=UPI000CFBF91B|nr:GTPase [Arthrobacter sp. MYb227]PQZ92238.1 ABC transporter [Arthrobacter sp. MYb227]